MAPVSDSDDDRPLVKAGPSSARAQATKKPNGNGNSKAKKVVESDSDVSMSDGDDAPLVCLHYHDYWPVLVSDALLTLMQSQATRSEPATPKARPQKRKGANGRPTVADSSSVEDDEDDDVPLALTPAKSAAVPMPGAIKATTTATTNGHAKQKVTSKPFINDADATNGSSSKTKAGGKANTKRVKAESTDEDDDDDDVPISKKAPARKKRKVKQESDGEDVSSDDDAPLVKPKKKTAIAKKGKTKANVKEESDEEDVKPAKGKKAAAVKKETDDKKAKKDKDKAKKEEEEEAEVFRWWEANAQGDGTDKWQKLEHNGVLFPPLYVPLPSNVKMKYDGRHHISFVEPMFIVFAFAGVNVDLPPESEEVAGFYAALMETDHAKDATFNKNFFDDWRKVLVKYPPVRKLYYVPTAIS
jgi:DNA topoisomerase-1